MSESLFVAVLVFYSAATVFYLVFLLRSGAHIGKAAGWTLAAGFAVHFLFTVARYLEAGYTPITNMHESLSFFSLATVGAFLALARKYRVAVLGSFVTPLALILMLGSASFPSMIVPLNPALKSGWLGIHTIIAFGGYAAFAIACCAGIMYLLQDRYLKKKKLGVLYRRLPSLDTLDEINYRCLSLGFPLLTIAIISGAIWAESAWGAYWSWDPKETWSLITWFIYAALLHGRLTTGWRGRKAAILAIAGFGVLLFTFIGVNLWLPGLHSYR
ncbi:MAG: c-type cytochrome biogenesis protein CcsB [Geobacteraceae bacterium]|nr:c-type cytochrome biogenesis protein CcsB [Geobacteraceae bacterium]